MAASPPQVRKSPVSGKGKQPHQESARQAVSQSPVRCSSASRSRPPEQLIVASVVTSSAWKKSPSRNLEELSVALSDTSSNIPRPELQTLNVAREKSPICIPQPQKSSTSQGKSPRLFQSWKNPPAKPLTNPISPAFDTALGTPEYQEPRSAWNKGWTSNIMYKEAMSQATVDWGGRPTTSTLDDVYGDGAESQKSARSHLVQDS